MQRKKYEVSFLIWIVLTFYLCIISKWSANVIFFDITSILNFTNLRPFGFFVELLKKRTFLLTIGMNLSSEDIWFSIRDFVFNIILFIPSGFCLYKMNNSFRKTIAISLSIQILYEICQLAFRLFNIGTFIFDIDDVIAAIIGTSIGVFIVKMMGKLLNYYKKL